MNNAITQFLRNQPESQTMDSIFVPNCHLYSLTPFGQSEFRQRLKTTGGFPEPSSTLEVSISPGSDEHFKNWKVLHNLTNKKKLSAPHSKRYIVGANFPSLFYQYLRRHSFYEVLEHLVTRAKLTYPNRRFVREICPPLYVQMGFMEPLNPCDLPPIFDPARRDKELADRGEKWGVCEGIDNRIISVSLVELTDDDWVNFILEATSPAICHTAGCASVTSPIQR